ncbi:chorismate mutase, partial [Candidatus Bathyarchaeota archaeon]|nr:chorismate mutase [Candidatus Bathyarchaeota archaeon]
MPSLEKMRKNIDKLDSEILLLLKKRVELAKRIGQEKRKLNLPIIDYARKATVLSKVIQEAEKIGLDETSVKRIFQEIISACETVQVGVKVAFLGPHGTFCEQAAHQYFGSNHSYIPYYTIHDVFRAVLAGEADYGIVPVENSLEGSVHLTLDLLLESNLCVCGETELQIRHNLLARQSTKINEIKQIFSHPQAFAQCRRFLEENLPNAEKI